MRHSITTFIQGYTAQLRYIFSGLWLSTNKHLLIIQQQKATMFLCCLIAVLFCQPDACLIINGSLGCSSDQVINLYLNLSFTAELTQLLVVNGFFCGAINPKFLLYKIYRAESFVGKR
jgi:hypothetical protein